MHGVIRVAATLTFLLFGTSCGKYSPLNERVVRVHFSPAITVEEATVYASRHRAKINHFLLANMDFVKTDSGGLKVEYDTELRVYTKNLFGRIPEVLSQNNDVVPDELTSRIQQDYSILLSNYYSKIEHNQEVLKHLKEEIDDEHNRLSTADLEVTDGIMENIIHGIRQLRAATEENTKEKLRNLNVPENCIGGIGDGWIPKCYH